MPLDRTVVILLVATSVLGTALIFTYLPDSDSAGKTAISSEDFDFSLIRSAEAAGSNALYLKVDGIPGSSVNSAHKNEIELEWYCLGYSSRTDLRGCNSEEGKNNFAISNIDGFHFVMEENKATPKLLVTYLNQTTIKTVTLSAQKGSAIAGGATGVDYLTITLNDVKLTSYFHGSNEDYSVPVVEISMSYSKIQMQYKEGNTVAKAGWDHKTNKPIV